MTPLLEKAINKVQELSSPDQDAIAAWILDELEDEARWDESFARSQDRLAAMAEKARGDIRAGRVRDVGMDEL